MLYQGGSEEQRGSDQEQVVDTFLTMTYTYKHFVSADHEDEAF